MTAQYNIQHLFLWFFSGGVLGGLFLIRRIFLLLLRVKKLGQGICDFFLCIAACFVVFLVALATDRGRLHFWQLFFQLAGFVILALCFDPFVTFWTKRLLRLSQKVSRRVRGLLPAKGPQKSTPKSKKKRRSPSAKPQRKRQRRLPH